MDEAQPKRVDESWKEQVQREKTSGAQAIPAGERTARAPGQPERPGPAPGAEALPQARFDFFVQGLVMEAFIALGEVPHPVTRKQTVALPQAKYLIDLLGLLEEKTRGNLTVDEEKLLREALYQLRMRYLTQAGGSP